MTRLTADQYRGLVERLGAGYRPAAPDVLAGLACAVSGEVVSCADRPPGPPLADERVAPLDAPSPYRLRQWTDSGEGWTALNDRLEIDVHGAAAMTHLDTPAHFWRGDRPIATSDPLLELARTGIVGRGILIDLASAPDGPAPLSLVEAELARTGVEPRAGDVLHLRFGRTEVRPSDVVLGAEPTRGLSIEAADWLAGCRPAAVVTDEGLDPMPSEVDGMPVPWHVLLLTELGIPLVDGAALSELADTCRRRDRRTFLSVLAPLPIPTASGSPLNPLALF